MAEQHMTEQQIWSAALEFLTSDANAATMEWLRKSRLVQTQSRQLYLLRVDNASIKHIFDTRLHIPIERAVMAALGSKTHIQVRVVVGDHGVAKQKSLVQAGAGLFGADESEAVVVAAARPGRTQRPSPDQRRRQRQLRHAPATTSRPVEVATPPPPAPPKSGHMPEPILDESAGALDLPAWINPRYTFDTFIVGNGNHFAYAAGMAVGDQPGEAYNPLFLYGGVGLGKTHLLHAIAHTVAPRGYRTLYVTSETFTNEIINAIRYRTTEEFRAKYRSVDLLLVDDIQFIAGKDSTEEEFFHTFNALHESGKQIVMCSDRPPRDIDLEERLRSRFEWGLTVDIQPPDLETRLAILRVKTESMGVEVSDSVLNYLAERIQTNVRQLEGMLNRVIAYSKLINTPLNIDVVKQALSSVAPPAEKPRRRLAPSEVLAAISTYYQISLEDLRGKQRDKHIVMPRQIAMWLMRQDTDASLMEIGQELGGRDHSTVLHGCNKIDEELRREDSPLTQEIVAIRRRIAGLA